jgi:hypothetical protein
MVALDSDEYDAAEAHARVAFKIYERLQDPWGALEARLLVAQVALARDDPRAEALVGACDRAVLDEAEPRQHRHLTRAWLAQRQGRWPAAASEIDAARAAFVFPAGESSESANGSTGFEARARTGDHTPHLLVRFSRSGWVGPAQMKIETWLRQIESGLRETNVPAPASRTSSDAHAAPSSDGPVTSRRA